MKIKKIEAIPVKLRMKKPFVIANVTNFDMHYVIVKLETDQGIVGYGEATPAWEVTGETVSSVCGFISLIKNKKLLGYSLLNKEIDSLDKVINIMSELSGKDRPQLVAGNPAAKASLEQAMLDALGKYLKKPIYKLFNAKNHPIPFTKNISIQEVKSTLDEVKKGIRQGYKIIRLKVGIEKCFGFEDYRRDVEVVRQSYLLTKKYRLKLVADANQGFIDAATTIQFCRQVENCLDWLEQPVLAQNLQDFHKIKKKVSVPLMADESIHNTDSLKILIDLGGIDYINIKLMKTGGLIQAIRMAEIAHKYKIGFQIGSMLESSIGAAMGCQFYCIKPGALSTDLNSFELLDKNISNEPKISKINIHLLESAGCGIKLNDEMINNFRKQ